MNAEIVDYPISPTSSVAGLTVEELHLPEGAIVALISRHGQVIPPRGGTRVEPGDHLFVVVKIRDRAAVENIFAGGGLA